MDKQSFEEILVNALISKMETNQRRERERMNGRKRRTTKN